MSKNYTGQQVQVHAGSGERQHVASRRHDPVGKTLPTVTHVIDHHVIDPATMEVEDPGQLLLFQPEDIEMALKIYQASCVSHGPAPAMREVMLFALKIAAINLDVHGQ